MRPESEKEINHKLNIRDALKRMDDAAKRAAEALTEYFTSYNNHPQQGEK